MFSDPIMFIAWLIAIMFALTIHEFSHALAAKLLGDDTAERMGRLSLNPMAHVDPMGLVLLVLVGFGWGKPVPVNPNNFKNPRRDDALVGLAGPFSNFLTTIFFTIIVIAMIVTNIGSDFIIRTFSYISMISASLMIFNLLPIPPLDGSHFFLNYLPDRFWKLKEILQTQGPMILLGLLIIDRIFNGIVFGSLFNFVIRSVFFFLPH